MVDNALVFYGQWQLALSINGDGLHPMASILKIVRALFGTNANPTEEEIARANFRHIQRDDPAMLAATQQARDSVGKFIELLQAPEAVEFEFHVKKQFTDGERNESMWLSDVRVDGDEFVGIIGNDPQILTHLSYGDEARVSVEEIRDWMVLVGDEMIGAYTVKVGR